MKVRYLQIQKSVKLQKSNLQFHKFFFKSNFFFTTPLLVPTEDLRGMRRRRCVDEVDRNEDEPSKASSKAVHQTYSIYREEAIFGRVWLRDWVFFVWPQYFLYRTYIGIYEVVEWV